MVKTRLAASLGADDTLLLYRAFLADTAWKLSLAAGAQKVAALAYDGDAAGLPTDPLGRDPFAGFVVQPQTGSDFGARLGSTLQRALELQAGSVVLVGADTPEIEGADIEDAFRVLEQRDVVLGPADDGGYYLVGMNRFAPALFQGIAWSTSVVLEQSLAAARRAGLSAGLVARRPDVDVMDDLVALQLRRKAERAAGRPSPCPATDAWLDGRIDGQLGPPVLRRTT
jgi:rSAM/selenodomain-associated transferase 1